MARTLWEVQVEWGQNLVQTRLKARDKDSIQYKHKQSKISEQTEGY